MNFVSINGNNYILTHKISLRMKTSSIDLCRFLFLILFAKFASIYITFLSDNRQNCSKELQTSDISDLEEDYVKQELIRTAGAGQEMDASQEEAEEVATSDE